MSKAATNRVSRTRGNSTVAALLIASLTLGFAPPARADDSSLSPETEVAIARDGANHFLQRGGDQPRDLGRLLLEAKSAESDRSTLAQSGGTMPSGVYDCKTVDVCNRLSSLGSDQRSDGNVANIALGLGIAAASVGTVALVGYFVESGIAKRTAEHVSLSGGPQGGSFQLKGTF